MPTIQTILTNLQTDVTNLAAYVASLVPSGPVPVNIAAALAAL